MLELPDRPKRNNETRSLTRPIVEALNALPGVWASRNLTGDGFARAGHPIKFGLGNGSADIVGCAGPSGRMFALEVKRRGKKQTSEQRAWAERMRRLGAAVYVVHSIDEAIAAVSRMRLGI